jgi:hypothetical protein
VEDFRDFSGPGLESSKTLVGYKDVLAHLDGTEEDEIRLRYAEAIAAIFGAFGGYFHQRAAGANELSKSEETPVELRRAVTTEARCADLFVASCPRGAGLGKWAH